MKKGFLPAGLFVSFLMLTISANADTIGRYAQIVKSIPQATLKADPKSQAWAHSARTILAVAEESITETIVAIQKLSDKTKKPLFCLKDDTKITTELIHKILEQKVEGLIKAEENNSLSEVVIDNIMLTFPCFNHSGFQSAENELFASKTYQMESRSR